MRALVNLYLGMAIVCTTGCLQISTFQTAKTIGKGGGEIGLAIGGFGISDGFSDNAVGTGAFEIMGRMGVGEKTDIGLKISHFSSYLLDVKFQIVGDRQSTFAMATGPGIGMYAFFGDGFLLQGTIPLHMSVHPSDRFAFYLTPRYSTQFSTGSFSGLHYLGGSVGIEAGANVRFGADISYMRLLNTFTGSNGIFDEFGIALYQVGVGVKFRIGAGRI